MNGCVASGNARNRSGIDTGGNATGCGRRSNGSRTSWTRPAAQAAPFSRGLPKRSPRRPGRKAGASYGRKAHRAPPARVDQTYDAPLPVCCPDCGGRVSLERHATQYQEDLPVVRPIVRAFQIAIGCCEACGRRLQGRHPLQTSDAIGAAAAQLGPEAVTLAVVLNKQLGLPLGKIATLLRECFGLTITCGGLVHAVRRAARQAEPTYAALCETIRGSPVVSPDETGWKVDARLQWLWGLATPDTTVYAIQPGRGFEEAAAVLGADFDGVLVRDGWAPYRRFTEAVHQTCLAQYANFQNMPMSVLPPSSQAVTAPM